MNWTELFSTLGIGIAILCYIAGAFWTGAKLNDATDSIALPWIWTCTLIVVVPLAIVAGLSA